MGLRQELEVDGPGYVERGIGLSKAVGLVVQRIMTQNSREALIELLFLALYLDDHLSLAEDGVVTDALDSIGWDSPHPREICILKAFSKAREAHTCDLKTEEYLSVRADVIKKAGAEATALTWLYKVLGADGISATEDRYLKRLEKRWYA